MILPNYLKAKAVLTNKKTPETSPAAAGLSLFQERFDIIMKFLFITAAPADDIFVAEAEKRNTDLPAEFELAGAL